MSISENDKHMPDDSSGITPQPGVDANDEMAGVPHPTEVAMRLNLLGKLIIPPSAR